MENLAGKTNPLIFGMEGKAERWRIRTDSRGQGLAEYLVIVVLIAVGVIVAVRYFGGSVKEQIGDAAEQVDAARSDEKAGKSAKRRKGPSTERVPGGPDIGGVDDGPVAGTGGIGPSTGTSADNGLDSAVGADDEDRYAKDVARLRTEVGKDEVEEGVSEIKVGWWTLVVAGIVVLAIGTALVFLVSRKGGKKKKKKKMSKTED